LYPVIAVSQVDSLNMSHAACLGSPHADYKLSVGMKVISLISVQCVQTSVKTSVLWAFMKNEAESFVDVLEFGGNGGRLDNDLSSV